MKLTPFTITDVWGASAAIEPGVVAVITGPETVSGAAAEGVPALTTVRLRYPAVLNKVLDMVAVRDDVVPAVTVTPVALPFT